MKKALLLIVLTIGLFGCKKTEESKPEHNIQFSSNIVNSEYYKLTINNANSDMSKIYNIKGGVDIKLKLYAAGGQKTNINGKDSLWITGTIYVDGKAVKYFAGYSDTVLAYKSN